MSAKFYAVKVGMVKGIFTDWNLCKNSVSGYLGAQYKSFKTREEADAYLSQPTPNDYVEAAKPDTSTITEAPYAYIDGSFNPKTDTYGYGGYLYADGQSYLLQGSGNDSEIKSMRNVSGEILGSMAAMRKARQMKLKDLVIYYDYQGIESWCTGEWEAKKQGTKDYVNFYKEISKSVNISFHKIKGHSGVEGNECADSLAKEAVGIGC